MVMVLDLIESASHIIIFLVQIEISSFCENNDFNEVFIKRPGHQLPTTYLPIYNMHITIS